jgi:hypothetical protein
MLEDPSWLALRVQGLARFAAKTMPEHTEARCDFNWRGGTLMISRGIRHSRAAAAIAMNCSTS